MSRAFSNWFAQSYRKELCVRCHRDQPCDCSAMFSLVGRSSDMFITTSIRTRTFRARPFPKPKRIDPTRFVALRAKANDTQANFEAFVVNHDNDVVEVLKPLPPEPASERTDPPKASSQQQQKQQPPPPVPPSPPTLPAVAPSIPAIPSVPRIPAVVPSAKLVPAQQVKEERRMQIQLAEYQKLYEAERGKNESMMTQLLEQQRVLQNKEEQLNQSHSFLMEAAKERAILRQQLMTRESQLLELEAEYHKTAQLMVQVQGNLAALEATVSESEPSLSSDGDEVSTMDYVPAESVFDILQGLQSMTEKLVAEASLAAGAEVRSASSTGPTEAPAAQSKEEQTTASVK